MGTVGWGILGTGKIARILARAIAISGAGSVVAVGSRDRARAQAFAAEYDVPTACDYPDVLDEPGVELVYVATHHPLHREWAVRALEAGKHVLCEKPMAVTHSDAEQIVAAARRHDRFLFEAFAYRCHPQTRRLVELVRNGAIGEVRMVDATFGYDAGPAPTNYLMRPDLAGGSILDVGCYTTSMAHLLAAAATGEVAVPTVEVAGAASLGPTGVDHSAAATLVFEGGLLARVASSIQANLDNSVHLYGSTGRITVSSPWLPGRIGAPVQIRVQRGSSEPEVIEVGVDTDIYAVEVDAVHTAVRAGERSSGLLPWDESLANMATLDRWRTVGGLLDRQCDRQGVDEATASSGRQV
jgi:predicted dehydrogenase